MHSVHAVLEKNRKFIHGIAHITGGGLLENIPRVLPPNLKVRLNTANWVIPEFMLWLKEKGEVEKKEFFRVFNAGIGLVLFVDGKKTEIIKNILESKGERVFEIGEVTNSQDDLKIEII